MTAQHPEPSAAGRSTSRRPGPLDPRLASGGILAAVIVLAAGLRCALLGQNSVWFDEAWVVWVARHRWQDIFPLLRAGDAHPPLYYLLMKAWIAVAGTGEAAIRAPSACLSVLSVGLTYALMRRVSPAPLSLLGAFLVSVSPLAIMVGQEARMPALLGMLALATTLALVASVERGGVLRWGGYVLLAAGMVYTQYLGGLMLLAHGVWVVWYERRHLGTWLLAMAAVAGLFLPWAPSLWQQLIQGNGWPWYRHAAFLDLGDLLGLLAFGGSLFGMGSYFFPGTLAPAMQGLILLPFLVLLGWGVASWLSDRRSLALVGLPLVVTGVVIASLSFAGQLTFYPRWFSFLVPFYAVLVARGLEDIAGRLRGRRAGAQVLLTAGLLAFGVPVLGRYYFDPGFRPYQWRAAADLVRRQVWPGDFLLFVNGSAEIAFTYYFDEPHPSLALTPIEATGGGDRHPTFTEVQAQALARRYPRLWLIATPPLTADTQRRLQPLIDSAYQVVGTRSFPGIWVHLLEARRPAPG